MKLAGRTALVVGASSGVGREVARLFAADGGSIVLAARSADALAVLSGEFGGCPVVTADVAEAASCARIVPAAIEALGGLDVVVYAAGVAEPCLIEDMGLDDFRRHLDVNLVGNFVVARAAALHMRERGGGSIVNVASELAHVGMKHFVHYCAAKAGVLGLTRALAAEMAPTVRVNSVSPGPIDTPMLRAEFQWFGGGESVVEAAIERVPLKRFATAREVAAAILFLAIDAPYATGGTLMLDGGTSAI